MKREINKSMVSRAIIIKLEKERNPNEIRTNHLTGYNSPIRIPKENNDEGYTPDITAVYDNETIIYEIELSQKMPVDKWRSFSKHAKEHKGSFYLVVPNNLKDNVKSELKKNEVNAGLITFNTEAK